jgi:hypothetical protein
MFSAASVMDPDPDPKDSYVFGSSGSGSRSFYHQAKIRIRIRRILMFLDLQDLDPDPSIIKRKYSSKKTLDFYCFVTSLWLLSLKTDVKYLQKVKNKKPIFC